MSEDIQFDESRHPVPTVEFDLEAVERGLGEAPEAEPTNERTHTIADAIQRFYDVVTAGTDNMHKRSNARIRFRLEVVMRFLGRHPRMGDKPISAMARALGYDERKARREAESIRRELGLPAGLNSCSGVRK